MFTTRLAAAAGMQGRAARQQARQLEFRQFFASFEHLRALVIWKAVQLVEQAAPLLAADVSAPPGLLSGSSSSSGCPRSLGGVAAPAQEVSRLPARRYMLLVAHPVQPFLMALMSAAAHAPQTSLCLVYRQ
ncbi:hypothetical protein HaLaN_05212 [Haematococcus lacustris]|uniref:Uncharacterized protein n=1 Tax=Haematococcus lacustris TaxID=44745 RepID=A0A699YIF6_HAELA|nr:hypothetical protein HaLaN_05212 [Haematococcus lacustris]